MGKRLVLLSWREEGCHLRSGWPFDTGDPNEVMVTCQANSNLRLWKDN